jgi:hypothetical protein
MIERKATACIHCSLACPFFIDVEDGDPVGLEYDAANAVTAGALCARGNLAYELLSLPGRLDAPLIEGQPARWPEALSRLADEIERQPAGSVGLVLGADATPEEAGLAGCFAAECLGRAPAAVGVFATEPAVLGNFVFASMDRVVHLGAGFGLGLSMSSTRIYTYESINSENLHGWYTGDGMMYLYNADLTQFSDSFWPTVNPRRLPGTTVDAAQARANASGQSTAPNYNWVGGATLGRWGVAGMQLKGWSNTLTAKKSWFMFDDEIVCLGAGITSTDNRTIETTIEHRLLNTSASNAFFASP